MLERAWLLRSGQGPWGLGQDHRLSLPQVASPPTLTEVLSFLWKKVSQACSWS